MISAPEASVAVAAIVAFGAIGQALIGRELARASRHRSDQDAHATRDRADVRVAVAHAIAELGQEITLMRQAQAHGVELMAEHASRAAQREGEIRSALADLHRLVAATRIDVERLDKTVGAHLHGHP